MTDLFGPLETRPNLGQGNEKGKTPLDKVCEFMAESGRKSLKSRKGELKLAEEKPEKHAVIIDKIRRPKGFGDQDERVRIKR